MCDRSLVSWFRIGFGRFGFDLVRSLQTKIEPTRGIITPNVNSYLDISIFLVWLGRCSPGQPSHDDPSKIPAYIEMVPSWGSWLGLVPSALSGLLVDVVDERRLTFDDPHGA